MTDAERIIRTIAESKKQTPVKVWVKGTDLPVPEGLQYFGDENGMMIVGDYDPVAHYLETYQNQITDTYMEQDRRNSAIPLLDISGVNARIEPGALIRDDVEIGDHAVIMMGAVINIGARVGEDAMIDMGAVLGGRAIVGKRCHVGAGAVLAGVIEPPSASPVILEDDVLVGANAVILEGVHIGKGAVIGAGAIVTRDVPAGAVAVGNPARVIKVKDEKTGEKTKVIADLRTL